MDSTLKRLALSGVATIMLTGASWADDVATCKSAVAADSLPPGVTVAQMEAGCDCLGENTVGDATLSAEFASLVEIADIQERLAAQTPAFDALVEKCMPAAVSQ